MPPPRVAGTVHRVTPAGSRPAALASAQIACSSVVVPAVPPRETNVAFAGAAIPAAATSANAWAALVAPLAATPAGSPVGPASTKSLIQIALPNGFVDGPLPVV